MGNACTQVDSVADGEDAVILAPEVEVDKLQAEDIRSNTERATEDKDKISQVRSLQEVVVTFEPVSPGLSPRTPVPGRSAAPSPEISQQASLASSGRRLTTQSQSQKSSYGSSDIASMFYGNVDTIEFQSEAMKELDMPDWYIDAAQELLRKQGILKTSMTYYQSMDFSHKADVWCNDKEEMIDKVELCGCLLKGCEKIDSDGNKWISKDDHHFLPVLIQGCRVVFSGDLKFKPIINEWVIDTTKELAAKNLLGVGWYCRMDADSDVLANSTKPNGKVVKGSTTFDKKGFPWICVDTSIGFYMPIFIDGKQVAFPKPE